MPIKDTSGHVSLEGADGVKFGMELRTIYHDFYGVIYLLALQLLFTDRPVEKSEDLLLSR